MYKRQAGNIAEWVADWYDPDYYSKAPERNPKGPDSGEYRVWRGGSWGSPALLVQAAGRAGHAPDTAFDWMGVRCAASPSSP